MSFNPWRAFGAFFVMICLYVYILTDNSITSHITFVSSILGIVSFFKDEIKHKIGMHRLARLEMNPLIQVSRIVSKAQCNAQSRIMDTLLRMQDSLSHLKNNFREVESLLLCTMRQSRYRSERKAIRNDNAIDEAEKNRRLHELLLKCENECADYADEPLPENGTSLYERLTEEEKELLFQNDDYMECMLDLGATVSQYEDTLADLTQKALQEVLKSCEELFSVDKTNINMRICLKTLNYNPYITQAQDATPPSSLDVVQHFDKIAYIPSTHMEFSETNENISKTPFKRDSGINFVYDTRDYYICNDIPKAYFEGTYVNEDLPRRLSNWEEQQEWQELLPNGNPLDKNIWRRAWHAFLRLPFVYPHYVVRRLRKNWNTIWKISGRREEAYYQSTLIIPLVIKHNDNIDIRQFLTLFNKRSPGQIIPFDKARSDDTLLFGALCLDSQTPGAFVVREELGRSSQTLKYSRDLQLGYFIADLLSIFLYIHRHFTTLCPYYKTAELLVKETWSMVEKISANTRSDEAGE